MVNVVTLGGTVPSSLWPRGKTGLPRRRPASSGLRNKRLQTNVSAPLQKLLNKCMEKVKSSCLHGYFDELVVCTNTVHQAGGGGRIISFNFIDLTWALENWSLQYLTLIP